MKNLKIGTQLIIGFAIMLMFVIALGSFAYLQTGKINQKTENLFNHPLKVRIAIGSLNKDILNLQVGLRDLMLAKSDQEKEQAIQLMELSAADAPHQFDVLKEQYLGPKSDIEEAFKSFTIWKTAREEIIKQIRAGEIESARKSALPSGKVGNCREQLIAKIAVIDNFASNKAEELAANSNSLKEELNRNIIQMVLIILILTSLVAYYLNRNIRKPISELTRVADLFKKGDRNIRSSYHSRNEFGVLSNSFNAMVDSIDKSSVLNEKAARLSDVMLSENDAREFFRSTINELARNTDSQTAAVYLLSDDKKSFEHFESIGLANNAKPSFAADTFEGEFGSALSSRKVQHIKDIPPDTSFLFHTVGGTFIPREILTLPIVSDREVIAVISLASIKSYDEPSIQLILRILVTLSARIEGILASRKMKEFSQMLEYQNLELQTQHTELASQSSELIEQNTELEMQKKQLFEASRLKTNFLSNMSHELRTPLNSVIALSGVLNRRLAKVIPEEEYSYLEVIERNGKHLLEMINDILDISRIEAGREEVLATRFDIGKLISDVVSMIHPQAQQKEIELFFTDKNAEFSILGDAYKCRHILQNLIGNAVKFTEKGKVEISARQSAEKIEISITDTGIGVAEKDLLHIFDEFRQADGSTSRKFGGTGLGLAIARKYANLLGGTISVKSNLNEGSTFTLILPVSYLAENTRFEEQEIFHLKPVINPVSVKQDSAFAVKTVLLVEDSEPAIIQLKDILEHEGFRLLIAHNGEEALEIIAKTIPDAIILDLMMPGMDGFEVLRIIRNAEPTAHLPVLVLTAKYINKEELGFLKRNNVHQLIQKGDVNRKDLLRAVLDMVSPTLAKTANSRQAFQPIDGKPKVLVVEDNSDNMITVKALLADNYTIFEAVDGVEAVALAKKTQPNLVLMDIALPGMDGIEAFKIIRNSTGLQHIPIIALTASAMTSDRETILAHGFDAYIAKPIDDKTFFLTINSVLYGN